MSTKDSINTIYIVPIEPIDQRYTKQWFDNIPKLIQDASSKFRVTTVEGDAVAEVTTRGAFLDFALTNAYKASQVSKISMLFSQGIIKPGDRFLVTDAWHFGIPAIRYMSELLNIPVEIHGIWHAGSYDPTDILGMKMNTKWSMPFEYTLYYALDYSYFATNFHKFMFIRNLKIPVLDADCALRSGQPHNQIIGPLLEKSTNKKSNLVMFPHRLNSDKQPAIVGDISLDFDVFVTQAQPKPLSKNEYYDILSISKVIFSCSLHENLGISMMEGVLAGCLPMVPDRASYSEMYLSTFKYPSEWTETYEAYEQNRDNINAMIQYFMDNYSTYQGALMLQRNILIDKYLTATVMIENITR